MIHQTRFCARRWGGWSFLLFAALILIPSSLTASRIRPKTTSAEEPGELPKPQVLNADTNPRLPFPAASFSGWSVFSTSYGWFDITKEGVTHSPVEPKSKLKEGFEVPFANTSEVQLQYACAYLRTGRKKRTVFYMPQDRWGAIHSGPGAMPAAAAKRRRAAPPVEQSFDSVKPQLLNAGTNPTLRFPIAYIYRAFGPGVSFGWLSITRADIRYAAERPDSQVGKGFEATRADLHETKLDKSGLLQLETSKGKFTIFYLPERMWGDIRTGFFRSNGYSDIIPVSKINRTGSETIQRTFQDFDKMVAAVKPPPPPEPQLTFQVEPATVQKGQPVTLVWTSMNTTGVELEPGDKTMPSQGTLSLTPAETTTYTMVAKGPGGSKSASAVVNVTQPAPAAPPTIILVEPSATSGQTIEVVAPKLKVRGVAMDAAGIPMVSINGTPANMRPQNAQAAEFWADPVTLHPGENKFEIVAINRGQAKATMTFVADYKPPAPPPAAAPAPNPKALGKQDILDLLKNFVPSARVADLVKQYGLKFTPTEDDLKDIQTAGGDDSLLNAVRDAAKKVEQ